MRKECYMRFDVQGEDGFARKGRLTSPEEL